MGFILRLASNETNLMALEREKVEASSEGLASLEAFEASTTADALEAAPALGIGETPPSSGSEDSSSDTESEDANGDGATGDDPSLDDLSSEMENMPEEDVPEEEPEDDPEEEESKARTESLRSLLFVPGNDLTLRTESILEDMGARTSRVWEALSFVAGSLASVGIRFSSTLLVGMYKVVLYTFAKTFKIIGETADAAMAYAERFNNRLSKQKTRIALLEKKLAELNAKKAKVKEGASLKAFPVHLLMYENSTDPIQNLERFTQFMAKRITGFNKAMLGDFGQLEEIANNRYLRREFDAMEFMGVNPATIGLIEHTDYSSSELETPNLCARYGTESMIGLVRLWAFLPRRGLDTWDQIEEAYKASRVFLEPINSANHFQYGELLSLKDVESLVQAASMLIREIEQHKVFYEEIATRRSGVLTTVKSLFVRLAQETVKVNFKNSTALPLYLKSSFVTKVYLVGAIDLHDHCNRVVANALSFAEAVLSKYD